MARKPTPTLPPAPAAPALLTVPRLNLALAIVEPITVALLFIHLLMQTWMRWGDPLIDFPRELYTAWRLSVGDLLYKNVMSWYGPLPHLVEGAAFKTFGVGLDTMVWLNIGVLIIALLLLRAVFGTLGGRLSMWVCSIVFLVVFAFGQFVGISNYNFITPYASQATYGLVGLLLTLWGLVRHPKAEKRIWLIIAGFGLAVAYLDKPEPLLAAAGALVVYFAAQWLRRGRAAKPHFNWRNSTKLFLRDTVWVAAGFFALYIPVLIVLGVQGGLDYALTAINWVTYTIFSSNFRHTATSSFFNKDLFGFNDQWQENLRQHLEAAGWLMLAGGALLAGGWACARERSRGALKWIGLVVVLAIAVAVGWRVTWLTADATTPKAAGTPPDSSWHFTWLGIGQAVVVPMVLAALTWTSLSLVSAWKKKDNFGHLVAQAAVGTGAALMLVRMILNGRIMHYGFFMMPLAMLFVIHLLVSEFPRLLMRQPSVRWPLQAAFALLALCGTIQLGRYEFQMYDLKTLAVGDGRDKFYSFPANVMPSGLLLNSMISIAKTGQPAPTTLIALPESAAVNYHTRIRDPIPEMEFLPTTLDFVGKERVLENLKDNPPDLIINYFRDLREYGSPYFGYDENSGLAIKDWLLQEYTPVANFFGPAPTFGGHAIDVYYHHRPNPASSPSPATH